MDAQTLWTAIKTYKTVKSLIDDGMLSTVLKELGDVHFETAQRELSKFQIAKDKKASVNRAVVSLETALTAYRKNLPNSTFDYVRSEDGANKKRRIFRVAFASVILCYLYLEEWDIAKSKIAEYDPYLYITKWDDRGFLDSVKELYGAAIMVGKIMIFGGSEDDDYKNAMDEFLINAKNIAERKGT